MAMLDLAALNDSNADPQQAQLGVRRKTLQEIGPKSPEAYIYPGGPEAIPPQYGNSESSRDRMPGGGPGTQNAPNVPTGQFNQQGTIQRAQSAPSMPSSPTPAAMKPFAPMAPPQGVQRKVILGGPAPSNGLLGRAGGLLGGGLGVPSGGQAETPDISALMQMLQQRRG